MCNRQMIIENNIYITPKDLIKLISYNKLKIYIPDIMESKIYTRYLRKIFTYT